MSGSQGGRRRSHVRGMIALCAVVSVALVGGIVGYRPLLAATRPGASSTTIETAPVAPTTVTSGASSSPLQSSAAPPATPDAEAVGAGLVGDPEVAPPGQVPRVVPLARLIKGAAVAGIGTTSGYVADAATGRLLYSSGVKGPLIPASTMKVLTSLAVLDSIDAGSTFTTRVLEASKGRIVLVGGGDPYLTAKPDTTYPRAQSAARLASLTASALKASGTTRVTLAYDDTLFSGVDWHPTWPAGYFGNVAPIHALSFDGGRDASGARSRTPHLAAAATFASLLEAKGITVTGKVSAARAPTGAAELARVESLPIETLVQEAVERSDNVATEVLLRQLALAEGRPASFAGGIAALQGSLTGLGVWDTGATVVDGSGLSRSNRVPAGMLGSAIRVSMGSPHLSGVLEALPVAGVSGTLTTRYFDETALPGRGWVHAKTGTLTKVSTLAGYTTTSQGRLVVFAFMSNNATNEWGARVWLDRVTGALTSCGC